MPRVVRPRGAGYSRRVNAKVQSEPDTLVREGAPPAYGADGLPTQDENGVDLTLIRELLRTTPEERLQRAECYMRALARVRPLR